MAGTFFLTGATGFLGELVLERLASPGREIRVLSRNPAPVPRDLPGNIVAIKGDLTEPISYSHHLNGVDTVIHLAAETGNSQPVQMMKVNFAATSDLVHLSKKYGVERFLFVSSIAVQFPQKDRYFYAIAKQKAEKFIRESGLQYLILRPSIILGKNSKALTGLKKLATLPLPIVFGSGKVKVQPVDGRDLATFITRMAETWHLSNQIIPVGGTETLEMRELLYKIREAMGLKYKPLCPVPVAPFVSLLSIMEPICGKWLPLQAGQLSSFRYDGITDTPAQARSVLVQWKNLEHSLRDSLSEFSG